MLRPSVVLRSPTARTWSWAATRPPREHHDFKALNVLFCGSDHFSIPSFTMLRELHLRHNDIISSLAVITPVDKPSGRGMSLKSCPMTIIAKETKYPLSHVSKFRLLEDELPSGNWDLMIAVSFGHLISPEVLNAMSYGGINVHPSMLPKYRGPAPLHHALLNGDSSTGISIQTLHPHKFDHGDILMQSEPLPLPNVTLDGLHAKSAKLGADMLRALLMRGYPANKPDAMQSSVEASYAPKINKDDMEIDWKTWSVEKIVRWDRILNTLWTRIGNKRVKVSSLSKWSDMQTDGAVGTVSMTRSASGAKALVVKCIDGHIAIDRLTIAGKVERRGTDALDLVGMVFGS